MKTAFLSCLAAIVSFGVAEAQIIGGSAAPAVQTPKLEKPAEPKADASAALQKAKEAQIQEIIDKEKPPVAMTPEQKSAIDLPVKKNIKLSVKKQNVRERKDFIDIMTNAERVQKRRAALLEGKDDEEAQKAGEKVRKPDIDPEDTAQMEKYVYQKAGLIDEK